MKFLNMKKNKIILLFLSTFFLNAYSQVSLPPGTYTSNNKKAIKFYEEGKKYYEVRKDKEAEENLTKALKEDDNFVEAHSALAFLLAEHRRPNEAIVHFEKAIAINVKFYPQNLYYLGACYMSVGKYDEAIKSYESLMKFDRINPNMKEAAQHDLSNARFGAEAIKNPKPFKLVNMGAAINSAYSEYFPSMTADGKQFLYTREITTGESRQEDLYIARKDNNQWQQSAPLNGVNTAGNEGAPSISADGTYMFFASCMEMTGDYGSPDRKGYGSCDIFYSTKVNGKWTRPQNIGPPGEHR